MHSIVSIPFRKQHLSRYLVALVTRSYDGEMISYLDMVGKMRTPTAGSPNWMSRSYR